MVALTPIPLPLRDSRDMKIIGFVGCQHSKEQTKRNMRFKIDKKNNVGSDRVHLQPIHLCEHITHMHIHIYTKDLLFRAFYFLDSSDSRRIK